MMTYKIIYDQLIPTTWGVVEVVWLLEATESFNGDWQQALSWCILALA